jgi:hypothetical protein
MGVEGRGHSGEVKDQKQQVYKPPTREQNAVSPVKSANGHTHTQTTHTGKKREAKTIVVIMYLVRTQERRTETNRENRPP